MSFPRYEAYRSSGGDWLGELPEHWNYTKLGRLVFMQEGPGLRNWQFTDDGIRVICVTNITENGINFSRLEKFISADEYLSSYRHFTVEKGDLLLSSSGNSWGKVSQYFDTDPVILNTSTIRLNELCSRPVLQSYLKWFLQTSACREQLGLAMTGACQPNFGPTHLNEVITTCPPHEEQTQIACFLDHETARIDVLIAEQERLIELLKEKRQAVISHAVTKGLAPTAPMKDSGVEWLGEVPKHWDVGALRWYATIQGGIAKGKDYEGRETVTLPYLRVANVQIGFVDLTEVKEISLLATEIERYSLRSGDVLMNEGGDNDKLGRGTVWQGQISPCLHQNHVFAIRPNTKLLPDWLAMFTQSEQARTYFYLNAKQSTNLASISASNVMSLSLPIPSMNEQTKILEYLETDRQKHEELVNVATSTVELLQERRSALISAAVTGKIDVRGWQTHTSASPADC